MKYPRHTTLKIIAGRPDLTPMITVLFLLLMFFMLYSYFVQVSGIKVDLPEVADSDVGSIEKLVITVDRQNMFFFNERPMNWENLQIELNHNLAKWRADTVIIRADRATGYGEVARLMSLARSHGLNVYLATMSEEYRDEELGEPRR